MLRKKVGGNRRHMHRVVLLAPSRHLLECYLIVNFNGSCGE
jgi:hypothetical protein